jgi:hypothetical protein
MRTSEHDGALQSIPDWLARDLTKDESRRANQSKAPHLRGEKGGATGSWTHYGGGFLKTKKNVAGCPRLTLCKGDQVGNKRGLNRSCRGLARLSMREKR